MRVFVAGATGAVGRPLLPKLVAAGHQVTGTTRSESRTEAIRAAGATPVVVDALDAGALREAVVAAAPEVVVHELTALPARFQPRRKDIYAATNRVRSEGTRNLLDAARAARARRFAPRSRPSSAARRASTTWSTTSRPRCATGCPPSRRRAGTPPPRRAPAWLARLIAGKMVAELNRQPGASNAKAKRELGWEPRWKSWREGFREAPR